MTTAANPKVSKSKTDVERLERELDQLHEQLDTVREDRDDFKAKWGRALEKIDRLEDDNAAVRARPFRPDVKRMDRGDWTRASCSQLCEACGCEYWEHPTVPGYECGFAASATEGS